MKTAFSGLGTLRQLPFYRTARDAFNRLFHPQAFVERKRTMKLLGGFVHPGSLVFDVGANHGKYTERIGLMNMKRWLAPRCLPALTRSYSLTSTRADHEGLRLTREELYKDIRAGRSNGREELTELKRP